ncbi:MAG: hypothetical protein WCL34_12810 [Methylococcaceae bacterium]
MKKIGIALISLGIFCAILAFNMNVSVGTIYNIGLLNDRQNILFISGIIFLAGVILLGFGLTFKKEKNVKNDQSENLNKFALYCSLPIFIVLVFGFPDISKNHNLEEPQKTYFEHEEQPQKNNQESFFMIVLKVLLDKLNGNGGGENQRVYLENEARPSEKETQ